MPFVSRSLSERYIQRNRAHEETGITPKQGPLEPDLFHINNEESYCTVLIDIYAADIYSFGFANVV